jgi:glyoxylase-like metal-dependent hydrolase (beta-lactamase superfamily II)
MMKIYQVDIFRSALAMTAFLILNLIVVSTGLTAENLESESHEFGTDPNRHYLPKSAIDSIEVPNIVLKEADQSDSPLPYYKLAKDVYMLFGNIAEVDQHNRGWNGNAGFVVTSDGVVVIDSLGSPKLGQRMIATIKGVTAKPIKYLIITHNHPDHSYGAVAFRKLAGVTVIGHRGTLDYIQSDQIDSSVVFRRTFIKQDMLGFRGIKPDIIIAGKRFSKYDLQVGDRTVHIYNVGQHHSYGDLVVHFKQDDVLWISDLAFNQRTTFMGDGDSKQAIDAQDWILTRFASANLMIPGHGSAQTKPFPMVRKTQSYIKRLREQMLEAIAKDVELLQAVNQADFKNWQDSRLYKLNHRSNANFVYRELEMETFGEE